MKLGAYVAIFATLLAIGYGVLFSRMYHLVEIDGGIVGLCAILDVVTCLLALGMWKLLAKVPNAIKRLLKKKSIGELNVTNPGPWDS
jgi:hypothetical protein